VATTANISFATDLQNGDTLDGITLATSDRVLVKDQSTDTENGIYLVVASGTASRDSEYDTVAELAGQLQLIKQGTSNADSMWLCTTDSGSIGSASITYSQVFPTSGGTVTSIAVSDSGSSEFTITGSPITAAGTITLAVDAIAPSKITGGVVPSKVEGTDFTDSLLVGHSTTGTLSSAIKNTIVGIDAGDAITSSYNSTFVGFGTGTADTTGHSNTFIGTEAGFSNSTTSYNTGVGNYALKYNTAHYNTAIGYFASIRNATGTYNTSLGHSALEGVTSNNHSYNTAVGAASNELITTGGYNLTLGYQSGDNLTTGSGNVIIGGVNAGSATGDRQLMITGYDGSTTTTWISGESTGNVEVATNWNPSLSTTGKALVMGF
jgi:hypothetical protein